MEDFAQLPTDLPMYRLKVVAPESDTAAASPFESFKQRLEASLRNGSEAGLLQLYDFEFNRLTNSGLNPPEPGGSQTDVKLLYSELFYRWAHSKTQVTLAQREAAFMNYLELFIYLKNVKFSFPSQWLWDMIEEFLFQFCSFWLNVAKNLEHDVPADVWELTTVQRVLGELVLHFDVCSSHSVNAPSSKHKNAALGYFAYYGKLRLEVHLVDFTGAFDTLQKIDSSSLHFYKLYPACYVFLSYYAGHTFFEQGRIQDSVVVLNSALSYYVTIRPFLAKSYLYHILVKKAEQALALLAIGFVMCPLELSPSVNSLMRSKLGDKFTRLQRGDDIAVFIELFKFSAPKTLDTVCGEKRYSLMFPSIVEKSQPLVKLISFARIYKSASFSKVQLVVGLSSEEVRAAIARLEELSSTSVVADGYSEKVKVPIMLDITLAVLGDKLVSTKHCHRLPLLSLIEQHSRAVARILEQLA